MLFLKLIDWVIIITFLLIVIVIGWFASKTAGKNTSEYFLGGRGMPWWLLGISMVACTFSADTPNLVAGMVRENGVAKNWAWWAFLITGMVTVFIYAKLWRRSGVLTDLEFYEKRYSGKAASFLRGFRAIYLGFLFNSLIMATVTLAAIKIGSVMLGIEPWVIVLGASTVVAIYTVLGGFKGVIWADLFQYSIAMFGSVLAAIVAVRQPEVGSLKAILENPALQETIKFIPDLKDPSVFVPLLVIPIAVQWWAVWYPGAEPGGGGYIAQKMLSAKNERNAIGATLFFNFAHYALRPWPWIIVALASLIIYPDLESIRESFPHVAEEYLKDDIAYPVMLTKLETGWLGFVTASIIAAYMSTVGTQLNWGSSYIVHDFYRRFVDNKASEKRLVMIGRFSTVLILAISCIMALTFLDNATQAFDILLLSGAGTGAIYILRWFWWRINAWTELIAIISATIVAIILVFGIKDGSLANTVIDHNTMRLLIAVSVTTVVWIVTALVTKPEKKETLEEFYKLTKPGGPGWKKVVTNAIKEGRDIAGDEFYKQWEMPLQILMVFIGTIIIYSSLFAIGNFVYGNTVQGFVLLAVASLGTMYLFKSFNKMRAN